MDIEPVGKTEYGQGVKRIKTGPFPGEKKRKPSEEKKKEEKKRKQVDVRV